MTNKQQFTLETVFAIFLASCIGFFWAMYSSNTQPFTVFARIPNSQPDTLSPTPSPVKARLISQISPDGTKKIVMTTIQNADTTKTYFFAVTDSSGSNGKTVFSKTLEGTKSMSIPFNAWSPDNQYFFIQEQTNDGLVTGIFAMYATGKAFVDGETYLDVTNTFINRNTGTILSEATGWASETLIIINTTTPENKKGPSYWFEMPSKAIIQLSTEF